MFQRSMLGGSIADFPPETKEKLGVGKLGVGSDSVFARRPLYCCLESYCLESHLTRRASGSHTTGMKAAVSIPDDVFADGERLAQRLRTSRSQLYARALSDFVVQHEDDKITAAMNRVMDDVGAEVDEFSRRAARRALRHVEW